MWSASQPIICQGMELGDMLFGKAITLRGAAVCDDEDLGDELDSCLLAVMDVLERDTDEHSEALEQAKLEWSRVVEMEADYCGIASKRAALLFAMWREPAVMTFFEDSDPDLGRDLRERVLPLVMPSFVAGMAQRPDALIVMVSVLCQMWAGESLGTHVKES